MDANNGSWGRLGTQGHTAPGWGGPDHESPDEGSDLRAAVGLFLTSPQSAWLIEFVMRPQPQTSTISTLALRTSGESSADGLDGLGEGTIPPATPDISCACTLIVNAHV
ncbi:hypothetical protein N7540_006037 [Penicillium herquei]|nr:hypothetical protein N7540_006037 [Penicillium herquei]